MRDVQRLAEIYREFMVELGLDLTDPDAQETPARVAKMFLNEFTHAENTSALDLTVKFFDFNGDQYVAVHDIPVHSLCQHHHLPFIGTVDIVYHPNGRILGLSKFARIVKWFAKSPTLQEKLTNSVADYLNEALHPVGLYIRVQAEHLCMKIRGVHSNGRTTTSAIRGRINVFEALEIIK